MHDVEIRQMDEFFLYLPVHYACARNWFGYLPSGYTVKCRNADAKTDARVYEELLDQPALERRVWFAICDPIQMLIQGSYTTRPVALASVVTNAAFWAVDRETKGVSTLQDLALRFDRIISFGEGSTSYSIAEKACIAADVATNPRVHAVLPPTELASLGLPIGKGAVAISPDPLRILHLTKYGRHEVKYRIHLALGDLPEFNHVLVTTLLTRPEVVQNHPDLVKGLLKAVQRAALLVRFRDPDVVRFAAKNYDFALGEEHVSDAITQAIDSHVFPASLEVVKGEWLRAAQAFAPFSDEANWVQRAATVYDNSIYPYSALAREAARDVMLGNRDATRPTTVEDASIRRWRWILPFGTFLLGLIPGLLFIRVTSVAGLAAALLLVWGAAAHIRHRKQMGPLTAVGHWFLVLAAVALIVGQQVAMSQAEWGDVAWKAMPFVVAFVLASVTLVTKVEEKGREQRQRKSEPR